MSADPIDDGCEREQKDRDMAIAAARLQAVPVVIHYTTCQYCGDPTDGGKKFCSYGIESCATESSWYQRTLQRTGVAR